MEIPIYALIYINLIITIIATIACCCVIDSVINIKTYNIYKKQLEESELEEKVGEIVDEKINSGGDFTNFKI